MCVFWKDCNWVVVYLSVDSTISISCSEFPFTCTSSESLPKRASTSSPGSISSESSLRRKPLLPAFSLIYLATKRELFWEATVNGRLTRKRFSEMGLSISESTEGCLCSFSFRSKFDLAGNFEAEATIKFCFTESRSFSFKSVGEFCMTAYYCKFLSDFLSLGKRPRFYSDFVGGFIWSWVYSVLLAR